MELNKQVWSLQLLRYLIFTKGYLRVSFSVPNPQFKDDFWLVNAGEKYDVIHIGDGSDSHREFTRPQVRELYQRIHEMINSEQSGRLLDISFNGEASEYTVDNIDYIRLKPEGELSNKVAFVFPEMNKVIYDVDDPQLEKTRLEKEIMILSLAKSREKSAAKNVFKERMVKSFTIPAILCVVIFAAIHITASIMKTSTINTAIAFGAYYKAFVVILNQYWRLLSSGFVHISILHLLGNLMSLMALAYQMEKHYGFKKSIVILIVSIIMGNLVEFVGGPNKVCVGLSGGLYGYLAALTLVYLRNGYFKNPVFRREFINTMTINLMISFLPQVSWMAHLGGFIAGGFLAVMLDGKFTKGLRINVSICMLVLCLAIGYFGYTNSRHLDTFYYQTDCEVADVYKQIGLKKLAERIRTDTYEYYMERS